MKVIAVDTETTSADPHSCSLIGTSVYDGEKAVWYEGLPKIDLSDKFVVSQNGKFDAVVLRRHGFAPYRVAFDTMIAQYVVAIHKSRKLEEMVKQYFHREKEDLMQVYNSCTGKERKNLPEEWYKEVDHQKLIEYALDDVRSTYDLYAVLDGRLEGTNRDWFYEIEMEVCNILIEMEVTGVHLDTEELKDIGIAMMLKAHQTERKLRWLADSPRLNLNSPKQIEEILYDRMGAQVVKKTETGARSTDVSVLKALANTNAFAKLLLNYREAIKLVSTYVVPLVEKAGETGVVHTQYNQALTRTRRFSSENPNLQNIPSRSELGQSIKGCFIPSKGNEFLVVDYSQMELRILAHASNDPVLIDAFKNNLDTHQITADRLKISRPHAKIINFAIVYGTTEFGLSKQLGVSKEAAKELIRKFFATYSGVKGYMEAQKAKVVSANGWVKSVPGGLPLYCGDTSINDKFKMEEIYRKAINSPIQAGSQDILKKAMVDVWKHLSLVPVLNVHDELVFDLPPSADKEKILALMENAWALSVPLKVSHIVSNKWEKE